MNVFYKVFCRVFQGAFRLAMPFLPYREPEKLGSILEISDKLKSKGVSSVLLVTDCGIKSIGLTDPLCQNLRRAGISAFVYSDTNANPTVSNVEAARAIYLKNNCRAIIAFGGGSAMDCAKAVGARIAYPKKTVGQLKGLLRVLKRIPPLFAIPTTAGTGSEVTVTAVITDADKKHKYTMNNFTLIPHYAVLDPAVTRTLPPHLTATTGMDALTHAVEAYIGRSTNKQTRCLALEATRLVFDNIEAAYTTPDNMSARKNMLDAAYKAGVAFSKSYVGYVHAVAHSLGGQYNVPHGLANAVLLPIVLENYGKVCYKKLYRLALAAGVADEYDSYESASKKFIFAIRALNNKMGIPDTIDGIKKEDIPSMSAHAAREANPLYPVPRLMNAKQLEQFYVKVGNL